MSKSLGNTLEVETLLKEHGADVCRWWVSSINTDNDIKVDPEFFKLAGEEYRKVRNTIRYLLSNLYDFAPGKDAYVFTEKDATSLDAWALSELNTLIKAVRDGYETFQFPRVREALFDFCNETMSAVYLAATKDRMYCDAAGSPRRRRTQTAMFTIAEALVKLVAPVLTHTADEAWAQLHKPLPGGDSSPSLQGGHPLPGAGASSVHLQLLPDPVNVPVDTDWAKVIAARDAWLKAIEEKRSGGGIENPLDTGLRVAKAAHDFDLAKFDRHDLADLCNVSRFEVVEGATRHEVADLRNEPRCERSWKRDGTVKQRSDGGLLSDRDAAAVGVA